MDRGLQDGRAGGLWRGSVGGAEDGLHHRASEEAEGTRSGRWQRWREEEAEGEQKKSAAGCF